MNKAQERQFKRVLTSTRLTTEWNEIVGRARVFIWSPIRVRRRRRLRQAGEFLLGPPNRRAPPTKGGGADGGGDDAGGDDAGFDTFVAVGR